MNYNEKRKKSVKEQTERKNMKLADKNVNTIMIYMLKDL